MPTSNQQLSLCANSRGLVTELIAQTSHVWTKLGIGIDVRSNDHLGEITAVYGLGNNGCGIGGGEHLIAFYFLENVPSSAYWLREH